MTMTSMTVGEILETYLPEPTCGCKSWAEHNNHVWTDPDFPGYQADWCLTMLYYKEWPKPQEPVVIDDGFVQDGNHRLLGAWQISRLDLVVPVEMLS